MVFVLLHLAEPFTLPHFASVAAEENPNKIRNRAIALAVPLGKERFHLSFASKENKREVPGDLLDREPCLCKLEGVVKCGEQKIVPLFIFTEDLRMLAGDRKLKRERHMAALDRQVIQQHAISVDDQWLKWLSPENNILAHKSTAVLKMKIMTKSGPDQRADVLDSMLRHTNISTTLDMYMHMRIRTQGWWIRLAFRMHSLGKSRPF